MVLIGDGVMALISPEDDALAWKHGPKLWKQLMGELQQRPVLTRAIGALQIAGGIWWAMSQEQEYWRRWRMTRRTPEENEPARAFAGAQG